MTTATLAWYFDYISPFSYLQSAKLDAFAAHATLTCRPVLFAGLLQHFGNVGPAEIEPKRRWTFEHVAWLAHEHGIPLKLPPAHPFNPLAALRLTIAAGSSAAAIDAVFGHIWQHGLRGDDIESLAAVARALGIDAPDHRGTPRTWRSRPRP